MDRESFPVGPDPELPPEDDGYLTPPWPYGMQQDSHVLRDHATGDSPQQWARPDFARIRDPSRFGKSDDNDVRITNKPVWNHLSTIVPRVYADTYSHRPHTSGCGKTYQTRLIPKTLSTTCTRTQASTGSWCLRSAVPRPATSSTTTLRRTLTSAIPVKADNPDLPNYDEFCDPDNFHYTWSIGDFNNGGCTDFDAVDCDCDCCAENNFEPPV
jgi:hypothetical protein